MKRSEINKAIKDMEVLIKRHGIRDPAVLQLDAGGMEDKEP